MLTNEDRQRIKAARDADGRRRVKRPRPDSCRFPIEEGRIMPESKPTKKKLLS